MAAQLTQLTQQTSASGAAQQFITTQTKAWSIVILAAAANAGTVYVGDSSVSSTNCGFALAAGKVGQIGPIHITSGGSEVFDLSKIYWAGTAGDKISVTYLFSV